MQFIVTFYPTNIGDYTMKLSLLIVYPNELSCDKFPLNNIEFTGNCYTINNDNSNQQSNNIINNNNNIQSNNLINNVTSSSLIPHPPPNTLLQSDQLIIPKERDEPFNPFSQQQQSDNSDNIPIFIPSMKPTDFLISEIDDNGNEKVSGGIVLSDVGGDDDDDGFDYEEEEEEGNEESDDYNYDGNNKKFDEFENTNSKQNKEEESSNEEKKNNNDDENDESESSNKEKKKISENNKSEDKTKQKEKKKTQNKKIVKTITLKSLTGQSTDLSKIKVKTENKNIKIHTTLNKETGNIELTIETNLENENQSEIHEFIEIERENGEKQVIPIIIAPKVSIDCNPKNVVDFGMCNIDDDEKAMKIVQIINQSNIQLKYQFQIIHTDNDLVSSFVLYENESGVMKPGEKIKTKIQFNAFMNGKYSDYLTCIFRNESNDKIVYKKKWILKASAFSNQIFGLPNGNINFGVISVGKSREMKYQVQNQSNHVVTCNLQVNEPFYVNEEKFLIRPKQEIEIIISFSPTRCGLIEENLELLIANKPSIIKIKGIGGYSELCCNLVNNQFDYQLMEYGSKHTLIVHLTNTGTNALRIRQIKMTDQTPIKIQYKGITIKNKITSPTLTVKRNGWTILRQNLFLAITNVLLDDAVKDDLYCNHGDVLEEIQHHRGFIAAQRLTGILRLSKLGYNNNNNNKIKNKKNNIQYIPYEKIIDEFSDDEENENEIKNNKKNKENNENIIINENIYNNINLIKTEIDYSSIFQPLNPFESYTIALECEPEIQVEFESLLEIYYETVEDEEVCKSLDSEQLITSENRIKLLPINIKGNCLSKVVFSPVKYSFGPYPTLTIATLSSLSFNTKPFMLTVQNSSSKSQVIKLYNISSDVFNITGNEWNIPSGLQIKIPILFLPKYPNVEYTGVISFKDKFTEHIIQVRGLGASAQLSIKTSEYLKYENNKYILSFGTIKPWKKYPKILEIRNSGLLTMPYKIILDSLYPFSINGSLKKKGILEKGENVNEEITFIPELYRKDQILPPIIETNIKWRGVTYGIYQKIPLLIECKLGSPKLTISVNDIDFGLTFVNLVKKIEIILTNDGDADCDWSIEEYKIKGITVEPMEGNILPFTQQKIYIIYKPTMPLTLYDSIKLNWDCGKYEIVCHGLVGIPSLSFPTMLDYDYDIIEIGTTKEFSVSIANTGNIHLAYVFVLGIDQSDDELKEQADKILEVMANDINMRDTKTVEKKQLEYNDEILNNNNNLFVTNYRNYIKCTTKQTINFLSKSNEYKKEYNYKLLFHYTGGEYYTGFVRFVGGKGEFLITPTNPASTNDSSIDLGIIKVNELFVTEIFTIQNIGNIPIEMDISHHIFMSIETLSEQPVNPDDCTIIILPNSSHLEPNDVIPITLKFIQRNNPALFDFTIDVLGYGKITKCMESVHIAIEIGEPKIVVKQDVIHFDRVQVHSKKNAIFVIENQGTYPSKFELQLVDSNNNQLSDELLQIFKLDKTNGFLEPKTNSSISIEFCPKEVAENNNDPNYKIFVLVIWDGPEIIFSVDGIGATATLDWRILKLPSIIIPEEEREFIKPVPFSRTILDYGRIHLQTKVTKFIGIQNTGQLPLKLKLYTEGDIFPLTITLEEKKTNGNCKYIKDDNRYELYPQTIVCFSVEATILESGIQHGNLIIDAIYAKKEIPVVIEGGNTEYSIKENLAFGALCPRFIHKKVINISNIGSFIGRFQLGTTNSDLYHICRIFYNKNTPVSDDRIISIFQSNKEMGIYRDEIYYNIFPIYSEKRQMDNYTLKSQESINLLVVIYSPNAIEVYIYIYILYCIIDI